MTTIPKTKVPVLPLAGLTSRSSRTRSARSLTVPSDTFRTLFATAKIHTSRVPAPTPQTRRFSQISTLRLQAVLQQWDMDVPHMRETILKQIAFDHSGKTGPQLEREYEGGALLLLSRIMAWLRLTYSVLDRSSLMLAAIHTFVSASSGQAFVNYFTETGGINLLLQILKLDSIRDQPVIKCECLKLLHCIAHQSFTYKQQLCDSDAIPILSRLAMQCRSREDGTLLWLSRLFTELARGNVQISAKIENSLLSLMRTHNTGVQRMAAQTLRAGCSEINNAAAENAESTILWTPSERYIVPVMYLLRNPNLHIQYEAFEFVKTLMRTSVELKDAIVECMMKALAGGEQFFHAAVRESHELQMSAAFHVATSQLDTHNEDDELDYDDERPYSSESEDEQATEHQPVKVKLRLTGRSRLARLPLRAAVARCIAQLCAFSNELALDLVEQHNLVQILCDNMRFPSIDVQRQSGALLCWLAGTFSYLLSRVAAEMGDHFIREFTQDPLAVCEELAASHIDTSFGDVLENLSIGNE